MNILYALIYAPDKGGSGAPIYTHHLMNGMIERGEHAGIVFSVHQSYRPNKYLSYQLHPLYFNHPPIFDNQPKAIGAIPFHHMTPRQVFDYIDAFYTEFAYLIQTEKYDLIHVQHGMYIGYAASMIKADYGTPYIISLHAMELNFLHEFPDPLLAMKAMVDANYICALSDLQKQRLLHEYTKDIIIRFHMKQKKCTQQEAEHEYQQIIGDKKINPDTIIVCPLGINTNHYDICSNVYLDDLEMIGNQKDLKLVMYAGRLIPMKGILHLLKAEQIYNKNNDVHTIILGGGECEDTVATAASKRSSITYLGFKEQREMPLYFNFLAERGGIFTVPSSSEGMSLVYLEAMACGARLVACCDKDMGGMDFMKAPFVRFTPFGDHEKLARAILELLSNTHLSRIEIRQKMIKYNLKNFQDGIMRVYEKCL